MDKIQFTEYEDRNSALFLISQSFSSNGLIDYDLRTIPDLRKVLKEKMGKSPKNLKTMEALETVAFELGIQGARKLVELFPKKEKLPHLGMKRKISKEEIKKLKNEEKSLSEIATIAGISRERVRQILLISE